MDEFEEEAMKKTGGKGKKHARLHKSLFNFSKALRKLHGHDNDKPSPSSSTTAASFLSACMHPRTHSFPSGGRQRHGKADDDGDHGGGLAADFRSLRIGPAVVVAGDDGGSSAKGYGDSESEGDGGVAAAAVAGGSGGVAVVTFSVAPYEDFRRSMREMVDARRPRRESDAASARAAAPAVDWDFMEELLFCYLQLNDRAVHKDILRAFTDTVAALRRRRRAAPKPRSRRTRRQRKAQEDVVDAASS